LCKDTVKATKPKAKKINTFGFIHINQEDKEPNKYFKKLAFKLLNHSQTRIKHKNRVSE